MEKMALTAKDQGIEDIMIHNVGLVPVMRRLGMKIHGGFGLNVFNSRALDEYARMGMADNELSLELTLDQMAALGSMQPRGMIVRGRIPMMLTRNCPASLSPKGCTGISKRESAGETCRITDRTGRELPVVCRMGCSEIFNPVMMSVTENISGRTRQQLSLDWVTLQFTTESAEQCAAVIDGFSQGNLPRESGITSGMYFKGVL